MAVRQQVEVLTVMASTPMALASSQCLWSPSTHTWRERQQGDLIPQWAYLVALIYGLITWKDLS